MAIPTPTPTPSPAKEVRTKDSAIAYLQTISESIKGFEGKPQYNPFLYRNIKINPLLEQLKAESIITVSPDGVRVVTKATPEQMTSLIDSAFTLTAAETNFHYPVVNRGGTSGADAYGALATAAGKPSLAGETVLKPVQ